MSASGSTASLSPREMDAAMAQLKLAKARFAGLRLVRPGDDGLAERRAAPEAERRVVKAPARKPRPAGTLRFEGRPAEGAAIEAGDDPRWQLAAAVSQRLQGAVLAYEDRQALLELGQRLGLTLFDANLVVAIVQDRARRGFPGDGPGARPGEGSGLDAARAGLGQLAMVGRPRPNSQRRSRWACMAAAVTLAVAAEAALIALMF